MAARAWRKASRSHPMKDCIELRPTHPTIQIRDSKTKRETLTLSAKALAQLHRVM